MSDGRKRLGQHAILMVLFFAVFACERSDPAAYRIEDVPVVELNQCNTGDTATFSEITGGVLLSGRLVVVDSREKRVRAHWPGQIVTLGHRGNGPGEYTDPRAIVAIGDGRALVHDRGAGRLLSVTHADISADGIPVPRVMAGSRGPEAADTMGGIYFLPGAGYFQSEDSVAVVRWNATTGAVDTMAPVKIPAVATARLGSGDERLEVAMEIPFSPEDVWTALPDGSLAIIRSSPIRLEVHTPDGNVRVGPPFMSARTFPVTDLDREHVQGISFVDTDAKIPEFKPAIAGHSPVLGLDDRIWVQLSDAPGGQREYLVFRSTGDIEVRVTLAGEDHLVAVGSDTVYAVRTDQTGLQRVIRYRPPQAR